MDPCQNRHSVWLQEDCFAVQNVRRIEATLDDGELSSFVERELKQLPSHISISKNFRTAMFLSAGAPLPSMSVSVFSGTNNMLTYMSLGGVKADLTVQRVSVLQP